MKVSTRDKYVLISLLVIIIGYVFYTYAYIPLKEKKENFKEELALLTPQMRDTVQLENNLNNLSKEKFNLEEELLGLKEEKGFNDVPYRELISYLGEKADELELDITLFTRMELNNRGQYVEIPYDIKVEGDYSSITQFVNYVYELDKYFFVTDIEMKEKDVLPLELVLQEEKPITMPFDWAESFIERLNSGIPVDSILKEAEGLDPYVLKEKVYQNIELSFKFYFVSLEQGEDVGN
jgi:Tfp pilus assembly protein PilO